MSINGNHPHVPDLHHLKGGDKAAQREMGNRLLTQQGFLCACGARIEDEGIYAYGESLGRFPTQQQGPLGPRTVVEDGAIGGGRIFHSRSCLEYLDALRNGLPTDGGQPRPRIVCVRKLPAVEWIAQPTPLEVTSPETI